MGALGVCKLSHLLIFVFQAQIDLEILNFQHYNISIKMIPLCHSTQKDPAGAECLSPDLCSVIPHTAFLIFILVTGFSCYLFASAIALLPVRLHPV